jgi:hypothetical protein
MEINKSQKKGKDPRARSSPTRPGPAGTPAQARRCVRGPAARQAGPVAKAARQIAKRPLRYT